ncbi:hypothetical protein [Christensenella intestinihominis]|uniref:hypothetical protein n=1 Tax=Christensenella intestinihominis TaxID=1851429 RepID=UPI0011C6F64F|nr:hypothetical protein [Christensenella intestinihominis]
MSNTKVPTLLKVTSILVIIGGALDIVVGLVGALLGAVVIYAGIETGTAALAWLGTLLIVLSLIYGVLKLVAGILGVQGKKLNVCLVLIAIIIAICVLDVVLALVQGVFTWYTAISLILPVLYLLGVLAARKQNA